MSTHLIMHAHATTHLITHVSKIRCVGIYGILIPYMLSCGCHIKIRCEDVLTFDVLTT